MRGRRLRRYALNHDLSGSSNSPHTVGPFRVLHQIGMGVLGPVFRAQGQDRQLVAIKTFKLDVPPEEAPAIAGALEDLADQRPIHPGLVDLLGAGLDGATPWIAMGYVAAPTLDTRLRDGRIGDLTAALNLIRALAETMDAAHAGGLFHGSLHPRDIFVDEGGAIRVGGFGIADALRVAGLHPPFRRPYTAPETLAGSPLDAPADRYALGAIAYELLTGRRLLGGADEVAARLDLRGEEGDVDLAATALSAMLAERPEHRPSSAAAFAQALVLALRPAGDELTAATFVPTSSEAVPHGSDGEGEALTIVGREEGDRHERGAPTLMLGHPHAGEDHDAGPPPSPEVLERFARQGTLWEPVPHRPYAHEADPAIEDRRGDDEDETAQLPSFAEAVPSVAVYATDEAPHDERSPLPTAQPRYAEASHDDPPLATPLRLREPDPDPILRGPHGVAEPIEEPELRTPIAREADAASGSPPLVVLALILALGLAIGGAGGYLLGQRSGERAAQRALGIEPATLSNEGEPVFPGPQAAAPPADEQTPESVAPPTAAGPSAERAPSGAAERPAPPARERAQATTGEVVVRSTPSRAGVLINGQWRGRTPLTVGGLPLGTHTVRVVEDGYVAETRRVSLDARVPNTTVSVQLARASRPAAAQPAPAASKATTGGLLLESRPANARVLVDGKLVGTTPLLISDLPPGARTVRIEQAGYRPWATTVNIVAGQRVRVAASLEEVP